MKRLIFLLTFLSICGAGILSAQSTGDNAAPEFHHVRPGGPGGPGMFPPMGFGHDWWQNSEVAQAINLTDAQKQQLSTIFSTHRPNLVQLRANLQTEEGKFRDILNQDQPQQDQVLAELANVQSARNALDKEFTIMALAFRGVISPQQWKQLQALQQQKMQEFRGHHHGPGGPDHGPGDAPPPPQD